MTDTTAQTSRERLAIVTTHPIQYHTPWFRSIAANSAFDLKVFYLWDFGIEARRDQGFGQDIQWDIPLLDGYAYVFVPNASRDPGTHHFFGLQNPTLFQRLRDFRPDAALLIGYKYASLLKLIFAGGRPFPLIMKGDSHRLVPRSQSIKSQLTNRIISHIYRRFTAVLYVGKANRDYFRMHGVAEDRLFFSPHAVDNDRFGGNLQATRMAAAAWRRELGISDDHLLILFAGKFEDKKCPLDLLQAFTRLDRADVSLLFVGDGHRRDELQRRAANIPRVFFAPFQNQTKMPRTYATCDLFVLPSFGPEETWGLSVNEALCLRRAVVVSTHVGCGPDLVRNGTNGLTFPAGDVAALAQVLKEALADRPRLVDWGEAGYKVVTDYSYREATNGLKHAFEFATNANSFCTS